MSEAPFGWLRIARLGLVQAALGAVVVFCTSTLNRVMVVEYALPATLPGALVAWRVGRFVGGLGLRCLFCRVASG